MPANLGNSLLGANPQQPFDLQTEQARLALAQKIAQEMLMQSLGSTDPTVDSGAGVRSLNPNVGMNMLKGMMARGQLDSVNSSQREIARALLEAQAQQTGQYMDLRTGGKFNEAVKLAAGSSLPYMQGLAQKDIQGMLDPKDLIQYGDKWTGQSLSRFAQSNDPNKLRAMPKGQNANGMTWTEVEGRRDSSTDHPIVTYDPARIDLKLNTLAQRNQQTGQETLSTYGDVTPERSQTGKMVDFDLKQLGDSMAAFRENNQQMRMIDAAYKSIEQLPADQMGTFADARNAVQRFVETLGGKKMAGTPKMEELQSALDQLALEKVGPLRPVTDLDFQKVRQIVGSPNLTKQGLIQALEIVKNSLAQQRLQHERTVKAVSSRLKLTDEEKMMALNGGIAPPPTAPSADSGGPPAALYYDSTGKRVK